MRDITEPIKCSKCGYEILGECTCVETVKIIKSTIIVSTASHSSYSEYKIFKKHNSKGYVCKKCLKPWV
jgi:hypothetical protein